LASRSSSSVLEAKVGDRIHATVVSTSGGIHLSRKLQQWTGRPWMVVVSGEQGAATLKAQADARQAELEVGVRADPLVKAVLSRFPGAEIVGVRGQKDAMIEAAPSDDDMPPTDDDGFGDNWVRDHGND
jgi:DNA polymerase-3 subunit gamma/tau